MRLFGKKHRDLQPWVEYFSMLQTYENQGYLQCEPGKNEAYVTQPALYTLSGCDFSNPETGIDIPGTLRSVKRLARRLRAYVGWKSQRGEVILSHPFALHVVKSEEPHDPLFTLLVTTSRKWWKLWMRHDATEVITYDR